MMMRCCVSWGFGSAAAGCVGILVGLVLSSGFTSFGWSTVVLFVQVFHSFRKSHCLATMRSTVATITVLCVEAKLNH